MSTETKLPDYAGSPVANRGDHAGGLVEGCPVCQSEKDAEAAENAPTQLAGRRKRTPKS